MMMVMKDDDGDDDDYIYFPFFLSTKSQLINQLDVSSVQNESYTRDNTF